MFEETDDEYYPPACLDEACVCVMLRKTNKIRLRLNVNVNASGERMNALT